MQNSSSHKRVELWTKSIKDSGNLGRHFPCPTIPRSIYARVLHAGDGAICSKNIKFVPSHVDSPNTRIGARLRSPSPIMVCYHKGMLKKGNDAKKQEF